MVLLLVDLFPWILLVLITLYWIVELALKKSLRLLGNSREVSLLPLPLHVPEYHVVELELNM